MLALPLLGLKKRAPPAMFRVPWGPIVAIVTLGLVVWLLSNSTWREARDTGAAAALGLIIYVAYRWWRSRSHRSS